MFSTPPPWLTGVDNQGERPPGYEDSKETTTPPDPTGLDIAQCFFFFWWPMCNFNEVREANKLYDAGFDLHAFGPAQLPPSNFLRLWFLGLCYRVWRLAPSVVLLFHREWELSFTSSSSFYL